MGIWKNYCERTHVHGFYELYDSTSKGWKLIWAVAVGIAILATAILVFNAADEFIKQPVRIMIERVKPDHVPYPSLKFCFLHWLTWVDWRKVEKKYKFSRLELLYTMSYFSENVYSSEIFDPAEIEASVKSKLLSQNMTLKIFFESIAKRKALLFYPTTRSNRSIDLTVLRKPYHHNIFDFNHLMCYTYSDRTMQTVLKGRKNNSTKTVDKPYGFEADVLAPFSDDHKLFLTDHEYNKLIGDFIKDWKMQTNVDYLYNIPIMLYPNGHSTSFFLLKRYVSTKAIDISMSAYIKHKNTTDSCDSEQKGVTATNITSLEDCIEESRLKILHENNAEEPWLGFAQSISPKKIYFLDKTGNVIENATFTRRHKLEKLYGGKAEVERMRNKTREVVDICSDKSSANGCEIWDIEFHPVETEPNGRSTVAILYPRPNQITMMKEVNVQTWSNFVGEVGGMLGIWAGASVMTVFQIFYLCFRCYKETE